MEDPANLLPELQEWNDGKGISVDDWVSSYANAKHAIGSLWSVWPEFIEHQRGVIVNSRFSEKNFDDFMNATGKLRAAGKRPEPVVK